MEAMEETMDEASADDISIGELLSRQWKQFAITDLESLKQFFVGLIPRDTLDQVVWSITLIVVIAFMYKFWPLRKTFKWRKLQGPTGLPYLGVVPTLLKHPYTRFKIFHEWEERYGMTYHFKIMGRRVVMTSDLVAVNKTLGARPGMFRRADMVSEPVKSLAKGLFVAEGDDWVRLRKLTAPSFTAMKVSDMQTTIAMVVERLMNTWDSSCLPKAGDGGAGALSAVTSVDALRDLSLSTLDLLMLIICGFDLNCLESASPLYEDVTTIMSNLGDRGRALFPYWKYGFKGKKDKEAERSVERITEIVEQRIAMERARQAGPAHETKETLLTHMLKAHEAEENSEDGLAAITSEEVVSMLVTFIVGGQDTTAKTAAWVLFFAATMPEVQRKLQAEADAAFAGGLVGLSSLSQLDVKKLPYQMMVLKEAMRLRPAAPNMNLQANEAYAFSEKLALAKNDIICLNFYSMSRDPNSFKDPEAFKPERWADDRRSPGLYPGSMPFGGGPRVCPGRFLAVLHVQLILAAVFTKFNVELASDCPASSVVEKEDFVLGPSELRLTFRYRV